MKKIILCLFLLLAFASSALAQEVKFKGLTFDVPEGYSVDDQGYGLIIGSPNNQEFLILSIEDSQGDNEDVIALSLSAQMEGSAPERLENGFLGTKFLLEGGLPGQMMIDVNGHDVLIVMLMGVDENLTKMYNSIK